MRKFVSSVTILVCLMVTAFSQQVLKGQRVEWEPIQIVNELTSPLIVREASSARREGKVSLPSATLLHIGTVPIKSFTVVVEHKGSVLSRGTAHMQELLKPGATIELKPSHWVKWDSRIEGSQEKGFKNRNIEPTLEDSRLWVEGSGSDLSIKVTHVTTVEGEWDAPVAGGILRCEKHMPKVVTAGYAPISAYRLVPAQVCACSCTAQCYVTYCWCITGTCGSGCTPTGCNICLNNCCDGACALVYPCKLV